MTVRPPDEILAQLTEAARNYGLTRNALICLILRDWLNQHTGPRPAGQ
jgi:hypothetical protein